MATNSLREEGRLATPMRMQLSRKFWHSIRDEGLQDLWAKSTRPAESKWAELLEKEGDLMSREDCDECQLLVKKKEAYTLGLPPPGSTAPS